ncbi:fatty acyl-AMP ligase [Pendulispora albinea]|uniref:Fatty acyl-AMP ligase n=1 Tax=Pendulispora albinea TaxID=2741071 RepID=A0ABZ2LLY1_9BACT
MNHVRNQFESIVTRFQSHVARHPERVALRYLVTGDHDGPTRQWNYATLDERARAVAAQLDDCRGRSEPVLLLYPTGLEFAAALLGCFYAGVPAVAASTPDPGRLSRLLPRLLGIVRDSGARVVLTDDATALAARALLPDAPEFVDLRWVATDDLAPTWYERERFAALSPDSLALLQYTSGSAGAPKGVMVTHGNLVANAMALENAYLHTTPARWVGWLPLFHDMGLMANLLQSWWAGGELTMMSPESFLQRPMRWLRALSAFGATRTGGPNFAFALCALKAESEDLTGLDLSQLAAVITGAEPVRARSLDAFARAFARYGFRRETFAPCYGSAEGTLFITGPDAFVHASEGRFLAHELEIEHRAHRAPPEERCVRSLMSCGIPHRGLTTVRVVDPETHREMPEGQVGEIWLRGLTISPGYWRRPELTEEAFGARLEGDDQGTFFRTGDLGFWLDGQLYPCTRMSDLIVLHGRSLYPHDLEDSMDRAHPAIRPGCTAALAIHAEEHGEALAVVAELDTRLECAPDIVADAIRHTLATEHAVIPDVLVFIEPRTLPKTSSGKVQRAQCRTDLLEHRLRELYRADMLSAPDSSVMARRGDHRAVA